MNNQLEQIRDQQQETWNKFSSGWKKWDDMTMEFLRPVGDEILQRLQPLPHHHVLDIAAGTGEPGLSVASRVTKGKVIITDLADGMLEVAREKTRQRGVSNVEFRACDVSAIPFPDGSFDGLTCRFGYMFFPDMLMATKEMARVLKPGGRVVASVWGPPEKNYWVTASMEAIKKYTEFTPPPPGAPGMFRCAGKGFMTDLFRQAGLKNIGETDVAGRMNAGTADTYWQFMTEVAAPVVAALSKTDEATKAKIRTEVIARVNERYPAGNVSIDAGSIVVWGEKQ
ncbi:MAG TPA: class I SAM-dependent methyltransferase [Bacteroidota bacterium]|nr:class I SAM-dependent methyltransferase [Bacteroidota bacterium]